MAYAQAPKKTGLSREVLKWLQSLDLSFSPKNVRRDFSNGYLVAEIFSWYYPEDFSMHSYDNGASLAAKLSNWAQIERFFTRQHILLPKEVIDGTIHCKPGAAELLVQEIYSILTHRRVKTWPGGEVDFSDRSYQEQLPMVARSTASKAIKNNLRQSEMVAEPNISTIEAKIQAIIQRHLEYRRLERLQDPSKIAQVKGPNNERCSSLLPSGFRASCETSHKAMIERFGVKPTLGERAARMPPLGSQSTQGPDSPFDPQPDSRVSFIRSRASVHFKETDSSMSTRTLSN